MAWLGSTHSVEAQQGGTLGVCVGIEQEHLQHKTCGAYGIVAIGWFRTYNIQSLPWKCFVVDFLGLVWALKPQASVVERGEHAEQSQISHIMH